MEILIGAAGILLTGLIYFAGVQRGRRQSEEQRRHDLVLEHARQLHSERLKADRRRRDRIAKAVQQYVDWASIHHDNGPRALSRLGLEYLGSDADIREAILEMRVRSGHGNDPWAGQEKHVEGVDLVGSWDRPITH